jgi:hypothetical protein
VLIKNLSWPLTRSWQKAMVCTINRPYRQRVLAVPGISIQKPRRRKTGVVMVWLCPLHTIAGFMGIPEVASIYFRPLPFISLLLLLVLSSFNSLHAQNATSGGLTGVVTDPSDALVQDASLELKDSAKGIIQTKSTNGVGEPLSPLSHRVTTR